MKLGRRAGDRERDPEEELGPEYIVPSVFNRAVAPAVAAAVAAAAIESGIARRERLPVPGSAAHGGAEAARLQPLRADRRGSLVATFTKRR